MAQIAMLRHELVDQEEWISSDKFNRVYAVYQPLPGPEATELAVYFGYLAGGRLGGFLAGLAFVLPGFALMLLLSWLYVAYGLGVAGSAFAAVFLGIQPAVAGLVVNAVYRIGKHALHDFGMVALAAVSLAGTLLGASFVAVLVFAPLAHVAVRRKKRVWAAVLGALFLAYSVFVFLNAAPVVSSSVGSAQSASALDLFAAGLKAGLLSFGGAYTVIPFLQQDAVTHGWLTNNQFLDGLALSGIVPAPLIIVSSFVGFVAGNWLGAFAITVAIFLPAFAFTLVGHHWLNRLVHYEPLREVLDGLTAGVVGLIAATAVLFLPAAFRTPLSLAIFVGALLVIQRFKSGWGVLACIAGSGALGWLLFR